MIIPKINNAFNKDLKSSRYFQEMKTFLRSLDIGLSKVIIARNQTLNKRNRKMDIKTTNLLSTSRDLNRFNTPNEDTYFYVHNKTKLVDVNRYKVLFCDLDTGRDSKGSYLEYKQVQKAKQKFLNQIEGFSIRPTWIVETRNGYQVYYVLDKATTNKTLWNSLQKKLANKFGGDPLAIKANQLMRVPYTWWYKPLEKKVPFFAHIVGGSQQNVNIDKMIKALDGTSSICQVANKTNWSEQWMNRGRQSKTSIDNNYTAAIRYDGYEARSNYQEAISCDEDKTKVIADTIDFLQQVSKTLYFSKNKFLANCANDLANKLSDKFCIG